MAVHAKRVEIYGLEEVRKREKISLAAKSDPREQRRFSRRLRGVMKGCLSCACLLGDAAGQSTAVGEILGAVDSH